MFPPAHIFPNPPRRDLFCSRPQPAVRRVGRSGGVFQAGVFKPQNQAAWNH